MEKLFVRLIALSIVILTLGAGVYMDFITKETISDPVAMVFFGVCLINISKLVN